MIAIVPSYVDKHAVATLELLVRAFILTMHDMLSWPDPEQRLHRMEFLEGECGIKLMTKLQELFVAPLYELLSAYSNAQMLVSSSLVQGLTKCKQCLCFVASAHWWRVMGWTGTTMHTCTVVLSFSLMKRNSWRTCCCEIFRHMVITLMEVSGLPKNCSFSNGCTVRMLLSMSHDRNCPSATLHLSSV